MHKTNLAAYNNHPFHPGGNALKRFLWYYVNAVFFKSSLFPSSSLKTFLLRMFGATIGKKVTIKPCVNIKYPWFLSIGDQSWVGENVWIDSLVMINIGANVCLSQGAMLLTGSHDYKTNSFNLITKGLTLEDGVWIGAGAIVNLGVIAASHAVLTSGSVATKNLEPYSIYQGNPAIKVRERYISLTEV
ncbi:WcaF family extracellular polysaccharide biosynthesis acetyltransferase [Mucilaginibacter sp. SP1R1]|uniref:WcaF family extracellular polysaccharide biosynthesis acetyltransferase n=1 Tax=Mucilaginibacter sp. SP1R1 TaxID=2723091 RepID=UPI001607B473|nr:WcaF family extracellular polysaccharide biosynthesis acetyltransferase [Mucilaginibacter sp. SP1R1]MBB6150983.1 putative colanic acid biosynthesis acetyltransferase WcaF [Mucilaginibacter sp. SP1R1]